jgi:aminoglycoside phosphotransferase family enzyme
VFLTDQYVYKLKKPLRGDGIAFTTVEARRRNAEAEIRLNRRLAPDVYLEVVPLTLAGGALAIGGKGHAVDWLVKMVRLPAERLLDRRLLGGNWYYADIHALAGFLAKFFATAQRVRSRRLPISTVFAANAGRAAVRFTAAVHLRCNMPPTALCASCRAF